MNEQVSIDLVEYERLLEAEEDLADLLAYDRAMARLASGDDELIPSEFVDRLIDGESPVRVYRDLRALTQTQLADKSGVNRVQIADIEARRKTGSVTTIAKLATALGVDMEDLVKC